MAKSLDTDIKESTAAGVLFRIAADGAGLEPIPENSTKTLIQAKSSRRVRWSEDIIDPVSHLNTTPAATTRCLILGSKRQTTYLQNMLSESRSDDTEFLACYKRQPEIPADINVIMIAVDGEKFIQNNASEIDQRLGEASSNSEFRRLIDSKAIRAAVARGARLLIVPSIGRHPRMNPYYPSFDGIDFTPTPRKTNSDQWLERLKSPKFGGDTIEALVVPAAYDAGPERTARQTETLLSAMDVPLINAKTIHADLSSVVRKMIADLRRGASRHTRGKIKKSDAIEQTLTRLNHALIKDAALQVMLEFLQRSLRVMKLLTKCYRTDNNIAVATKGDGGSAIDVDINSELAQLQNLTIEKTQQLDNAFAWSNPLSGAIESFSTTVNLDADIDVPQKLKQITVALEAFKTSCQNTLKNEVALGSSVRRGMHRLHAKYQSDSLMPETNASWFANMLLSYQAPVVTPDTALKKLTDKHPSLLTVIQAKRHRTQFRDTPSRELENFLDQYQQAMPTHERQAELGVMG